MEGFLETHYEMIEGTQVPDKPKPKTAGKMGSTATKFNSTKTTNMEMGKTKTSIKKQ